MSFLPNSLDEYAPVGATSFDAAEHPGHALNDTLNEGVNSILSEQPLAAGLPQSLHLPPLPRTNDSGKSFFVTVVEARGSTHKSFIDVLQVRGSTTIATLVARMAHKFAPSTLFANVPSVRLAHKQCALHCLTIARWLSSVEGRDNNEPLRWPDRRSMTINERVAWSRANGKVLSFMRAMADRGSSDCSREARAILDYIEHCRNVSHDEQTTLVNSDWWWMDEFRSALDEDAIRLDCQIEELLFALRRQPLANFPVVIAKWLDKRSLINGVPSHSLESALQESISLDQKAIASGTFSAESQPALDDYYSFLPRAWCDGKFLRWHYTVESSVLTPQSTVYLLFECPHLLRAQKEFTYGQGSEERGFAVFVRHNNSLTLVRITVHVSTTVARLKSKLIPLCYNSDQIEKERRVEEKQRRRSIRLVRTGSALANTEDEDEEEVDELDSFASRCILLHHGRVLFETDTLILSGVGAGDVLTLLDKVDRTDAAITHRYAAPEWYGDRVCAQRIDRSTIFDIEAVLAQLSERVDSILYHPRNYRDIATAFQLMDEHHSDQLRPQEYSTSLQTILRLTAQRLVNRGAEEDLVWLDKDAARTGAMDDYSFCQPSVLPSSHHVSFHQFLRLLSDSIVEIIRAKQFDLVFPLQSFAKPEWLTEHDHLTKDNYRLMHSIYSALHQQQQKTARAQRHAHHDGDGSEDLPHSLHECLERAGAAREARDALKNSPFYHNDRFTHTTRTEGKPHAIDPVVSTAFLLVEFLKGEQERAARSEHDSALNLMTGYTFPARKAHDCALRTVLDCLSESIQEDIDELEQKKQTQHLLSYVKAGCLAILKFFVAPFVVFLENSPRIWLNAELDTWHEYLLAVYAQFKLFVTFLLICGAFYTPMTLILIYHVYAAHDSNSEITLLECYIPFGITALLVVYSVSATVSAQVSSSEDDENKLMQHYEAAKLVTLEMRTSPVLLDFDCLDVVEETSDNSVLIKGVKAFANILEQVQEEVEDINGKTTKGLGGNRVAPLTANFSPHMVNVGGGLQRMKTFGPSTFTHLPASADGVPLHSRSVSRIDFGFTPSALDAFMPQPTPNLIGKRKTDRLRMAQLVLGFRLDSPDPNASGKLSVWLSLLFLTAAACYQMVPGIYRQRINEPFFGDTWFDQYIAGGAWISLLAMTEFLRDLGRACQGYHAMSVRLENCHIVADSKLAYEHRLPFYLDLRLPQNLEYWLTLRERAKQVNENWLAMMAGSVIVDAILIVAVVVRIVFYGHKIDLFDVVSFTAIILFSMFIIAFLLIVVKANTVLGTDHLQLMQRLRHELSFEMCSGDDWIETVAHTNTGNKSAFIDTWSEAAHLDTEVDEEREERAMEHALIEQDRAQFSGHTLSGLNTSASESEGGELRPLKPAAHHSNALAPCSPLQRKHAHSPTHSHSGRCVHGQPSVSDCMTCTLQSHTQLLHNKHSKKLGAVHSLLSNLHGMAAKGDILGVLSLKFQRFELEAKLIDSTIQHMQTMDEPIKLLGLVVNQALLMQVLTLIATGAASALSSVIPSSSSSTSSTEVTTNATAVAAAVSSLAQQIRFA